MKIKLPNRCVHSELNVAPTNWHTKSTKITIDWFISYRFYDPKYPSPKQVKVKKINCFKVLEERQEETEKLLHEEIEKLKGGFNSFNNLKKKRTNNQIKR